MREDDKKELERVADLLTNGFVIGKDTTEYRIKKCQKKTSKIKTNKKK